MTRYRDIPYMRKNAKTGDCRQSAVYRRVISHIGKALKAGKAVRLEHRIIDDRKIYSVIDVDIWD